MTERRFPRTARINEVVLEVLAEELERMSDPRLEFVTITGVQVSTDLKHARVFYSSLEDDPDDDVVKATGTQEIEPPAAKAAPSRRAQDALESARRHLQSALGRQVRLKYVPRLAFEEDRAIQTGQRIEELIRDLHDDE